MDGRRELRSPSDFEFCSSKELSLVTMNASTENVSTNGARLQNDWPWLPRSRVLVRSSLGEFCGRARIVYCHRLPANPFALGLQFLVRTGDQLRQSTAFAILTGVKIPVDGRRLLRKEALWLL
jgi:hypothetical protein